MRIHHAIIIVLCAFATTTHGQWSVISSDQVSQTTAGGRRIRIVVEEKQKGERARMDCALFDLSKVTLKVIDQPGEPRTDLAQAMEDKGYLAGVNGGYFDEQFLPVGLLISNGQTIAPFRKARLLSGVLAVTKGRVQLQRTSEFSTKTKPTEAMQCGPFLVDHGRPVAGLNDSRPARRTFVAVGTPNTLALGFCTSVSLAQLSRILASGAIDGEFKVDRALNLDGGSSSAFWFKPEGERAFSIGEQKTVRDFLGVLPK